MFVLEAFIRYEGVLGIGKLESFDSWRTGERLLGC